jgi:hypothetical protein
VLQYNFNWKSPPAVAGQTTADFFFRLYAGAVKSPEVIDFLQATVRHVKGPALLIWDRLPARRNRLARDLSTP